MPSMHSFILFSLFTLSFVRLEKEESSARLAFALGCVAPEAFFLPSLLSVPVAPKGDLHTIQLNASPA